jgi:hypothetical protein
MVYIFLCLMQFVMNKAKPMLMHNTVVSSYLYLSPHG